MKGQRGGQAGRPLVPQMLQIEEDIFEMVGDDPTIRATAAQVEVSDSKVWKTLR